jgi:hypothetical protein
MDGDTFRSHFADGTPNWPQRRWTDHHLPGVATMTDLSGRAPVGRLRDAVRLLFLLDEIGTPVGPGAPPDAIKVVYSQMRLQAADFWVRNPDYLAHEILNEIEQNLRLRGDFAIVEEILSGDEPELRRYPMLRWRFGAYEPLDDALAVLKSHGYMIRRARGTINKIAQHDYFLTAAGASAAASLEAEFPDLIWYRERACLVATVVRDASGSDLKERQHSQFDYHDTHTGEHISSIIDSVRERLMSLKVSAS